MTNAEKLTLKKHACHIRMGVFEGTHSAGCGHPGGSLSIADVLSYLYFKELNIDPTQPRMASRDRLVLSKGHAAPAFHAKGRPLRGVCFKKNIACWDKRQAAARPCPASCRNDGQKYNKPFCPCQAGRDVCKIDKNRSLRKIISPGLYILLEEA